MQIPTLLLLAGMPTDEDQQWSNELSRNLFQYLTVDEPMVLPGYLRLPDPLVFPNMYNLNGGFTVGGQHLYGLSNLKIKNVSFNLSSLTAQVEVGLPFVTSLGEYLWETLWSDSSGAFNITLGDVRLTFRADVVLDEDGHLTMDTAHATLGMKYGSLNVDFEDLWAGNFVIEASLLVSLPTVLDMVKDWLVGVVKPEFQRAALAWTFPDSIPRLDYLVTKVEPYLRGAGLDPWPLGKISVHMGLSLYSTLDDVVVTGLSSLHRTSEAFVSIVDTTVSVLVQVGTTKVHASGVWEPPLVPPGVGTRFLAFVDSFTVTLEVQQEADLKSPPVLRTLDCRMGNIGVRFSGMGSFDYLAEAMANLFPNVFRDEILNQLEPQMWQAIQAELNNLDVRALLLRQMSSKT
ncbi:uncharacterized protein [Panulirus ornatus]|uniref:uncharacterized protein isoform X2 n=1 Tax=Panulirus ornatus TaxID=150431 RepID=UPI003A86F73E